MELRIEHADGITLPSTLSPSREAVFTAVRQVGAAHPVMELKGDPARMLTVWWLSDGAVLATVSGTAVEGHPARRLDPGATRAPLERLADFVLSGAQGGLEAFLALPLHDGPRAPVDSATRAAMDDLSGASDTLIHANMHKTSAERRAQTKAARVRSDARQIADMADPEPILESAPMLSTNTIYGLPPMFGPEAIDVASSGEPDESNASNTPTTAELQPTPPSVPLPLYGLAPPEGWIGIGVVWDPPLGKRERAAA